MLEIFLLYHLLLLFNFLKEVYLRKFEVYEKYYYLHRVFKLTSVDFFYAKVSLLHTKSIKYSIDMNVRVD